MVCNDAVCRRDVSGGHGLCQRCRSYFVAVWAFLLGSRDKCLAYMRYFYSPYFTKYSAEDHKKRFMPLLTKFSVAFQEEADIWMIQHHILNVMLDFAVKIHNDQMPNNTVAHKIRAKAMDANGKSNYNGINMWGNTIIIDDVTMNIPNMS